MKPCRLCGVVKPLDLFYPAHRTLDGRDSRCKECVIDIVRKGRVAGREGRRAYLKAWGASPSGKASRDRTRRRHRAEFPGRVRAVAAVSNAIRDGRLQRGPCARCGATSRVQAHHPDYSRPLDVVWLCFNHHRAAHGVPVYP